MKTLTQYILESESTVAKFLKDNYKGKFKISSTPNSDGKYEVSSTGKVELKNTSATSLTNGEFIFTECKSFFCEASNITSLEGAPRIVKESFSIDECENLTSLEGFPEEVGFQAYISFLNIKDLTGMPEKIKGGVKLTCNPKLVSLKGCPKEIGGIFQCFGNKKLMGLEDGPKHVKGISVDDNGKKFTKSYITSLIKIDEPEFGRGY